MRTYTINESAARLSHEMRSFSDYKKDSATAGYNADVAKAAAILEQVKALCSTEAQKERAEYLFDRYAISSFSNRLRFIFFPFFPFFTGIFRICNVRAIHGPTPLCLFHPTFPAECDTPDRPPVASSLCSRK